MCSHITKDRKNYNSQNCLFVGDAMSDYGAAQKNGICFLGIVGNGEISPFSDGTFVSSVVTLEYFGLSQ